MDQQPLLSELFIPRLDADTTPENRQPRYVILFRAFQQAILQGHLLPGARLPASRVLCKTLGISRNTVKTAYEMLQAEGYIDTRPGAGSFVSAQLPDQPLQSLQSANAQTTTSTPVMPRLSAFSQRLQHVQPFAPEPPPSALLAIAEPDMASYPWRQWQRSVANVSRNQEQFALRSPMGNPELRQRIAEYLQVVRGVHCTAEQVLICSGAQQAMYLALQVLVNPGEPVWVEDPGYAGIDGALAAVGAVKIPVPADADGFKLDLCLTQNQQARIAILTPSRNFPMGYTLSLERRLALIRWAKQTGRFLIEDDYDSEFRFDGAPFTALQGLGGEDCVLYAGTFSRILHHSLRLGYLVLPPALVPAFAKARRYLDGGLSQLPQLALADFMASGHFSNHVRRMRKLYRQRRALLSELIQRHLADSLQPVASEGSMHSVYWLAADYDDVAICALANQHGLGIRALSSFYSQESEAKQGLVMGFAAYDEQQLEQGVLTLKALIETHYPR